MTLNLVQRPSQAAGLSYIEQFHAELLPQCENPRVPVILGFQESLRVAIVWRPRCKLWSCPVCAQINKQTWAHVAAWGVEQFQAVGKTPVFMTLTSHERLDLDATRVVFPRAWKLLHARMRRKWGDLQYFMVPEHHADGRLHIHGIASEPVPTRWLKDNGRACGLGYIADSRLIDVYESVVSYIVKHLAKQLQDEDWPIGFRRVRTSRGWPKPDPLTPGLDFRWVVLHTETDVLVEAEALRREGYTVIEGGHRTAWRTWEALRPIIMLKEVVLKFCP